MNLFSLFDSSALQELINNFISGVPRFVAAVAVAILGFIIAKIVAASFRKFFKKINVDAIGDKVNEIDIVHKSNIKIKISTILYKIIYYVIILFFLVAASDILAMPAVSNLVSSIFSLIPNIIVAGIILIVGTLFADTIRSIAQTSLESLAVPSARLISSLVFYFLFVNIIISALSQAQIDTDFLSQNISLLIAGGIFAFAIGYGLASKNSMSNFLASYYSKGKFDVGDTISIDGVTGKIANMDKSSLVLISDNGNKIIFPLSKVSKSKIEIHI